MVMRRARCSSPRIAGFWVVRLTTRLSRRIHVHSRLTMLSVLLRRRGLGGRLWMLMRWTICRRLVGSVIGRSLPARGLWCLGGLRM